ncbi:MAG: tetratricopeptide repeat protein [Chloroflexi bacterium]|nr:tetratricopeptide repeat protein [Chloroflexota bacterium]
MARLRLNLLGAFQATLDDQPLAPFRSDKARALLAYLAMEGHRPHPRDRLADLLWGDYPQEAARASLRQALSNLRQALAPLESAGEPLLAITRQNVTLATGHPEFWTDAGRFDELMSECARHVHQELARCSECILHLCEASELYRGDFLAGLFLPDSPAFDEWRLLQQEARHQQILTALNALTIYYGVMGEDERVLDYAHQTLALVPWHEAAHRQVMDTLARLGRRNEALAQYEQCRQVLADELGVEPEPETIALYVRIKEDKETRRREISTPLLLSPSPPHNLPPQPTPFIGREQELDRLARLLVDPAYRLITVAGEGGVGKTRLALAAAARVAHAFAEGVWFVPLAGLSEQGAETIGHALVSAIADTLGFRFHDQSQPQAQLFDYLRQKEMLLVLDNFEHLLAGMPFVLELWRRAPQIVLLVTSRERLNLQAEYTLRLEGLPVPADAAPDAATYSSLKLFAERADRTLAGFTLSPGNVPDVAQLCRLVEGIPLGIELAAALVEQVSPAEMAGAIRQNLAFLATTMADLPARHRSMHAVFDYSWQLLTPEEQRALAQLSVFRGTFDPIAAEAILDLRFWILDSSQNQISKIHNLLSSLVDKSLLRQPAHGRYEMHQLLRQFTAEKLDAIAPGERLPETTQERHSRYYLAFVGDREAALNGRELPQALVDIRQEMDNVRQAWRWAVRHAGLALVRRSLPALARFYTVTSLFQEGEATLALALEQLQWLAAADDETGQEARYVYAHLLAEQAALLNALGRYEAAIASARAAVSAGQETDDVAGYPVAAGTLQWGVALWYQGDLEAANPLLEQALSLAQAAGPVSAASQLLVVDSLRAVGSLAYRLGRYAEAGEYYERALRLAHDLGDRHGESQALRSLGAVARNLADYAAAQEYYRQGLAINRELGDRRGQSGALNSLGDVSYYLGHFSESLAYYGQSLAISREIGDRRGEAIALNNLGTFYDGLGQYETAQDYHEQSLRLKREIGFQRGEGWALDCLGLVYHHLGDHQRACECCQRSLRLFQELGDPIGQGFALTYLGHALAGLGRLHEAAAAYQEALALRRTTLGQPHQAMETLAGLARVSLAQGKVAEAHAQVEEILRFLEHSPLDGTYERFRIHLTCYQVLTAVGDSRAPAVRQAARSLLQKQATKISDGALRRSFLENVAAHRELL